jgi:wobble nucleotide-excising tRNase
VKEQMLPCPFCGNTNKEEFAVGLSLRTTFDDEGRMFPHKVFNACCSCGAKGPNTDSEEEAVEKWNTHRGLP